MESGRKIALILPKIIGLVYDQLKCPIETSKIVKHRVLFVSLSHLMKKIKSPWNSNLLRGMTDVKWRSKGSTKNHPNRKKLLTWKDITESYKTLKQGWGTLLASRATSKTSYVSQVQYMYM